MTKIIYLITLVILFFYTGLLRSEEIDIGEITVTATKTEKKVEDVPASITIIDKKILENISSQNSLSEIATISSGVLSQNIGGFAGVGSTTLTIRGIYGINTTLVLVDGQSINEGFNGAVNFNFVPKFGIEKIEITKGPFSSLYLPYAMGGVINIITKKHFDKDIGVLEIGNFGYRNFEFISGKKVKNISYFINASKRITDNYFANENFENTSYEDGKVRTKINYSKDNSKISYTGNYFKSRMGSGYTEYLQTKREKKTEREGFQQNIQFENKMKSIDYNINLSYYISKNTHFMEDQVKDAFPPKFFPSIMDWKSDDIVLSFLGKSYMNQKNKLLFGIDNLWNKAKLNISHQDTKENISNMNEQVYLLGIYLQDEYISDKLTVISSLRYDKHSVFSSHFSPKISSIYKFDENKSVYLAIGSAFRTPTLADLYIPDFTKGGKTFKGNPQLKPEKALSYEIGSNFKLNKLKCKVVLFRNNMKDLISLYPVAPKVEQYQNINKATTQGVEVDIDFDKIKNIKPLLNYTYLKTKDEIKKEELEYSPKNKLNLILEYINKNMSLWLLSRYTDNCYYVDRKTSQRIILSKYIISNINFTYKINDKIKVTTSVKNLTNTHYQEFGGYDAPKRTYSLGLNVDF